MATQTTTTTHECTLHEPGSLGCHRHHGCRCDACRAVSSKARKRSKAGCTGLVDVALVRAHINRLHAAGHTYNAIGAAAGGLSHTQIEYIATRARSTHRHIAAKILAVRTPDGEIDGTGAHRRVDALQLQGWTLQDIGDRLGVPARTVWTWTRGARLYTRHHHALARLATQLATQIGPSTRSAARAARRGALPLLAWDEGTGPHGIDNPNATPVDGAHDPTAHHTHRDLPAGRTGRTPRINLDEVEWLLDGGTHPNAIAERLKTRTDYLIRLTYDAGRPDLSRRLRVGPDGAPRNATGLLRARRTRVA